MSDAELLESFLTQQDEAAFDALVTRHGPLVLSVCRRVLKNLHDAEDAFQATFLVLVRKAASIGKRELLANWLYGVAYRTAMKSRSATNRKRAKEQQVAELPQREAPAEEMPDELIRWLDHELIRLPDKLRLPVVCCDLQGMSRKDAAGKLGWPIGTLNWRLAKARTLLAKALTQRGLTLSAGALALALSRNAAHAAVSPGLRQLTVRAGKLMLTSSSLGACLVSAKVASLTEGVVKSMFLTKLKMGLMVLISVVGIGTTSGLASYGAFTAGQSEVREQDKSVKESAEEPVKRESQVGRADDNFLVNAPSDRIARIIGNAAEEYRRSIALEWFGKELPRWTKKPTIAVKIDSSGTGGATNMGFEDGKVSSVHMNLEGPLDRILDATLPHEITHVLFAHHFGCPLPRWADEGVAILSSDQIERTSNEKALEPVLNTPGRFITLDKLFAFKEFPSDAAALYAEGYSLTRYLVESRNRQVFLQFVADGMRDGWEKAASRHYGYGSIAEMEEDWLHSVKMHQLALHSTRSIRAEGKAVQNSAPSPLFFLQQPISNPPAESDGVPLLFSNEGKPSKGYDPTLCLRSVGVQGKDETPLEGYVFGDGSNVRLVQKDGVWTQDQKRIMDVGAATIVLNVKLGRQIGDKIRLEVSIEHNDVKKADEGDTMVVRTSMQATKNVRLGKLSTIYLADAETGRRMWVKFTLGGGIPPVEKEKQ
jgi:RNA polymerase sigma factor (sigma-70 family)